MPGQASSISFLRLLRGGHRAVLPALSHGDIDRHGDATKDERADGQVDLIFMDEFLVHADEPSEQREHNHPESGAGRGVDGKAQHVHAGHSGRAGDDLTNTRDQTPDKGRNLAMFPEELLHLGEFLLGDPEITADLEDQGTPEPDRQVIIEPCAKHAAKDA